MDNSFLVLHGGSSSRVTKLCHREATKLCLEGKHETKRKKPHFHHRGEARQRGEEEIWHHWTAGFWCWWQFGLLKRKTHRHKGEKATSSKWVKILNKKQGSGSPQHGKIQSALNSCRIVSLHCPIARFLWLSCSSAQLPPQQTSVTLWRWPTSLSHYKCAKVQITWYCCTLSYAEFKQVMDEEELITMFI